MISNVIKSILIWATVVILTIILFFVMFFLSIVLYSFDKKRKIVHAQCFWWASAVLGVNPYWKVRVSGLENIDRNKTYVIVSNHQSLADIAVIYRTKMQFKWVAKESLFRVPFIGWSLALAKHIKLARGELSSIKEVYREAAIWLRKDVSVLFFPEGTRSETAKMLSFQNGAFKLAIRERVPILPIRLKGTGDAIPKGNWLFKTKVYCSLKVLPSIDTSSFLPGQFAQLRDIARRKMEEA